MISRCTSPWLCRKRIPSTTSSAICRRVLSVSPALGRQKGSLVTNKTTPQSNMLKPTPSSFCRAHRGQGQRSRREEGKRKAVRRRKPREREEGQAVRPDNIPWRPHTGGRMTPHGARGGAGQQLEAGAHFQALDRLWTCP